MEQIAMWTSMVCLFVGLICGYFVGYRSGAVAGELAALKSMRHRSERDESPRRSRRSNGEGRKESSD